MNERDDRTHKMLWVKHITRNATDAEEVEYQRLKAMFEKEQRDASRKPGLGRRGGKGRKGPDPSGHPPR